MVNEFNPLEDGGDRNKMMAKHILNRLLKFVAAKPGHYSLEIYTQNGNKKKIILFKCK